MENRNLITQLFITWLFYNCALIAVLWLTCWSFGREEYETVVAMMIFSFGVSVIEYDWWALKNNRYERRKTRRQRVG